MPKFDGRRSFSGRALVTHATLGHFLLGTEGLALLRLSLVEDPKLRDTRIEEMRSLILQQPVVERLAPVLGPPQSGEECAGSIVERRRALHAAPRCSGENPLQHRGQSRRRA